MEIDGSFFIETLARDAPRRGAWKAILRLDPCTYCGGPGGTVDHIDPRPVTRGTTHRRGVPENLTGACQECNRRKDTGNGQHRDVLSSLYAATENKRRVLLIRPWEVFPVDTRVDGPFFTGGIVIGYVEHRREGRRALVGTDRPIRHSILVRVPLHTNPWRCANPFCLRKST